MNEWHLDTDELKSKAALLRAGDRVLLSGTVYTSRDAAHKRIIELIKQNKPTPYEIKNSVVYYAGPTPTPNGLPIGSCGPTTSGRMDPYSPALLDLGQICMIGKGPRNGQVVKAIMKNRAVYLCALGGAGALAAECITHCEVIAFEDLGCESVKKLTFKDFPLIVGIDADGGNIFDRE